MLSKVSLKIIYRLAPRLNLSFKPRLVGKTLPYDGFAHREDRSEGDGLQDYCILHRLTASFQELPMGDKFPVLAIELVGSRFLRRMVRILVVSCICGIQ
jgi:hypothetical protein